MNHRLLSIVLLFCAGQFVSAQTFPYQNPNLSAKERAKDLCSRLTLEEKAKLLVGGSNTFFARAVLCIRRGRDD